MAGAAANSSGSFQSGMGVACGDLDRGSNALAHTLRAAGCAIGDHIAIDRITNRSPRLSRIKRLRIFPEMCASTRRSLDPLRDCPFRETRNIVPGRTDVMVPSISMALSLFIMIDGAAGAHASERRRTTKSGLTGDCRRKSRPVGADVPHEDALH